MVLYIVVWYIQESGTINVVKKIWLCGPCSSCTSPLINFGTAPFMLANGMWIMGWCIGVCSHDCWCRILPLHWTPLKYEFWVQGSTFPKRCWKHIFFYLLWTPAQSEHDMITFVGPYSWLAMQFSVEGHITCSIVWWIFGGIPKMYPVFKQCYQHMCLFFDNHCSFCNCNRTSFHELLRQKVNHESWGWVTVQMVKMSAACDGGEIGRPPFKLQPSSVAPESVCLTCQCFSLSKTCRRRKRSVHVLTFFVILFGQSSECIFATFTESIGEMDDDVWICGAVRVTPVFTNRSTVHRLGSASLLLLTADTASHVPCKMQVCRSNCLCTVEIYLATSVSGDSIVVMRPKF